MLVTASPVTTLYVADENDNVVLVVPHGDGAMSTIFCTRIFCTRENGDVETTVRYSIETETREQAASQLRDALQDEYGLAVGNTLADALVASL